MPTMETKKAIPPPPSPAYRVFISSTNDEAMKEFRKAAESAITDVGQVPVGMERFEAGTVRPLAKINEEIDSCQILLCLLGTRYGSICTETSLSYTETEFNEAESKSLSILAFEQDGVMIDPDKVDADDLANQQKFKSRVKKSGANRIVAPFKTADELRRKIAEALRKEIARLKEASQATTESPTPTATNYMQDYKEGAKLFKRFILLPGRYNNRRVRLRVRMDGNYGTWKLKDELFSAFDMPLGNAVYLNDLMVLGSDYRDVDESGRTIDMFAKEDAADWVLENDITKGSVFEGEFRLAWKHVRNIAGTAKISIGASDAFVARLILEKGIKVVPEEEVEEEVDDTLYHSSDSNVAEFLRNLMS